VVFSRVAPKKRLAAALAGVIVAGGALGFAVTSGGSSAAPARAVSFSGPVRFSRLARGTPLAVAAVPRAMDGFIDRFSAPMGMKAEAVSQRVHLARSAMGPARLSMYVFLNDHGRPCFYVPTFGGVCDTPPETSPPGFYWLIGGNGDGQPSYLMALADDAIRAISLKIGGREIPVSLRDDVAFADYPATSAPSAAVTVRYANGRTTRATLALR
jgi:hypothetical protein